MSEPQPLPVTLGEAVRFWLKLGFISFGGPAGQISIMHKELVEKRRWISEGRFLHALNYCMLLPGPEATQLAVYIGWLLHGTVGGVIAGTLFVLPGALLLVLLSWLYISYGSTPLVAGLLFGFKAAVIALILGAVLRIGSRAIRSAATLAIALAAFVITLFHWLSFPLLVLGAAILGWIGQRIHPASFEPPTTKKPHAIGADPEAPHAAALIDDHTPTPPHAEIRLGRMLLMALVFLLLLGAPIALLHFWRGYDDIFARMSRLFTLAAFVTIGGAYAVLPYISHMSTTVYGWLQPGQMVSGLALGETTPGPLILVLTFVGFVGAWNVTGTQLGLSGAFFGAAIATYFTFLPSFMFILLGGPFVEHTRGGLRIGAILASITAAVVGVIGHMGLTFGQHVLLPAPADGVWLVGSVDLAAATLCATAIVAIQFLKADPLHVILACGIAGVLVRGAVAGF